MLLAGCLVFSIVAWAMAQTTESEPVDHQPPPPRDIAQGPDDFADHGHPPHDWRDRDKPLDEQEVRDAMDILRQIDPDKAAEIDKAFEQHPDALGEALRKRFPNIGRFLALRNYDPQGFELRIQDLKLSRQSRDCVNRLHEALDAGDDELAATEQVLLAELVAEHFDVRQQMREYELTKLKQRIDNLIVQLQERTTRRDDLIQQRVDDLINNGENDRW